MSRTSLYIPLFILAAFSVVFLLHYFIYFSVVHLLSLTAIRRKVVLGVALFLLPASFIVASILTHRGVNSFSRALYFCSSLWLGVGLTLAFFFALAWAAWGAAHWIPHSPSRALFGWTALALTCVCTAYGVWNAGHLTTRHIAVHLKNLPHDWQEKTVVQISDVHLGAIRGAEFLEEIVERANAENPSAVFITGDLFDGSDGRLEDFVAPLRKLHAPRGIFFVTGNHEVYLGVERTVAALGATPVKILNDEMVTVEGLQIIGISYPSRGFSKDVASAIGKLPDFHPQLPSILLYHNPSQVEQARAAGIDLQLAGHTHHGQIFPMQIFTRMIFGKYYYGLHAEGDYTMYTTSGAGTWGPTMRTGNHPEIVSVRLE